MDNDESTPGDSESHEEADRFPATSVTDLIDSIEREAFERYVANRELRHQFGWHVDLHEHY